MRVLKYALLWLILASAFAFIIGNLNLPRFQRLKAEGVQSQGIVVKLTPEFHNTLQYQYQINGRTYENQSPPEQPNPPIEQMRVGQTVVIYYDSEHPNISVLGDPKPMLENEIILVRLAALIFPTLIVFALVFRKSRKQKAD